MTIHHPRLPPWIEEDEEEILEMTNRHIYDRALGGLPTWPLLPYILPDICQHVEDNEELYKGWPWPVILRAAYRITAPHHRIVN